MKLTLKIKLGRWSFGQLRLFLQYKGLLNGVPAVVVNPRYTSQTCNVCKHIGKRTAKHFKCSNCRSHMDADVNASINIATLEGAVNRDGKSNAMCCAIAHVASGLKSIPRYAWLGSLSRQFKYYSFLDVCKLKHIRWDFL